MLLWHQTRDIIEVNIAWQPRKEVDHSAAGARETSRKRVVLTDGPEGWTVERHKTGKADRNMCSTVFALCNFVHRGWLPFSRGWLTVSQPRIKTPSILSGLTRRDGTCLDFPP